MKDEKFKLTVELGVEDIFNAFRVNGEIANALVDQQGERSADIVLNHFVKSIKEGFSATTTG